MTPDDRDERSADRSRLTAIADRMVAPVAVLKADGSLLYVNAAAARALGAEPAWLIGRDMLSLVHPSDRPRIRRHLKRVATFRPAGGDTRFRIRADPAQDWRVLEAIADNLGDDATVAGILLSVRDITDQVAYERALNDAAYRDPLTGLGNRAKIDAEVEQAMSGDGRLAVAFVGIDRFRLINDTVGHRGADAVLQAVANRISLSVPATTVVGRFEGDLLVLLIMGPAAGAAGHLLWRVVDRVTEPLFVGGFELRVSLSVGVAHRDPTATAESLMGDASLALSYARSEGGGRVKIFETEMRTAATVRLEMEADLRRAVTRSEFALALQPIVSLPDRKAVGAEALLRWRTGGGIVEPESFIPVAEETGLIVPIGEWVIDRGAQLAIDVPGKVTVNLSARQLASPGLVDRIVSVLRMRDLPPSRLGFEITETLLIRDFDFATGVLSRIRSLGCPIGLDDFGTGYSSLGYLRRLPIDFLKIDGSLSADVDRNQHARAIIGAILTMARALGLDAVVEGVETEGQADALCELGCDCAQGYLFGGPVLT